MNLGAEISHQYISSPSSLLTGHQAWGLSCAKVNGHPEVPRCPHLATYPSPWDTGLATCARLAGVFRVRSESPMKSQVLDTILVCMWIPQVYMELLTCTWNMPQKEGLVQWCSGVGLGPESLGWVCLPALPLLIMCASVSSSIKWGWSNFMV